MKLGRNLSLEVAPTIKSSDTKALNRVLQGNVEKPTSKFMEWLGLIFGVFIISLTVYAISSAVTSGIMCMGKGCTPKSLQNASPERLAKFKEEQAIREAKPGLKQFLTGQ